MDKRTFIINYITNRIAAEDALASSSDRKTFDVLPEKYKKINIENMARQAEIAFEAMLNYLP